MSDENKLRVSPKRNVQTVFEEAAQFERKLQINGPDNIRPDSRHQIIEIASDHVAIRLLGDDILVLPYASITSLRVAPTQITIRYG